MKHARTLARAAAVSLALFAFSSGAAAEPLVGQLYGVGSSVNPATGPVTNNVAAFVERDGRTLMRVMWQCGQPTPCSAAGVYVENGWRNYWFVTQSADAPAPLFLLAPSPDCVTRYGANSYIGHWVTSEGRPTVTQCFSTTRFQRMIRLRPGWPPLRAGPITLPPELRIPEGDAPRVPQNQMRPARQPTP